MAKTDINSAFFNSFRVLELDGLLGCGANDYIYNPEARFYVGNDCRICETDQYLAYNNRVGDEFTPGKYLGHQLTYLGDRVTRRGIRNRIRRFAYGW